MRLDWASGKSCFGPPKFVGQVEMMEDVGQRDHSHEHKRVAHELGHAVGMPHHGRGDYRCEQEADCKPLGAGWVAVQHGQHSGCDEGYMRYVGARFIEEIRDGKKVIRNYCPDDDPWCYPAESARQTLFCDSDTGTGVNAPEPEDKNPLLPKAGDATPGCGNSLGHIRISDRYDSGLLQLNKMGCQ